MPYKDIEKRKEAQKRFRDKRRNDPIRSSLAKEYSRLWSRNSLKAFRNNLKKGAIRRNIYFGMQPEEFIDWWQEQEPRCYYCGRENEDKRTMQIDRKIGSEGYIINNIVLACFECNRLKSDLFTDTEWLEIVEKYNLKDRY